MMDILTFEHFITPSVLIFIYYIGLFFIPFLSWKYKDKFASIVQKTDKKSLLIVFIVVLLLELMWRMMFEMMIGYFDIHNYLQEIQGKLKK